MFQRFRDFIALLFLGWSSGPLCAVLVLLLRAGGALAAWSASTWPPSGGGIALLYEGHRYNKVRDGKEGTVYWRCARDRQCPGRAVTVYSRIKKANNKHNHPPDAWRNKVDQVVSDLKLRAQDDATTLPTLFTETLKYLASSHQVAALAMPTFPSFKGTVCKPRHQLVPSLLQLRDFRPEDNWLYANSTSRSAACPPYPP
ncbi:hypothetical protein MRX96_025017 [Rhipicephalus microplus]